MHTHSPANEYKCIYTILTHLEWILTVKLCPVLVTFNLFVKVYMFSCYNQILVCGVYLCLLRWINLIYMYIKKWNMYRLYTCFSSFFLSESLFMLGFSNSVSIFFYFERENGVGGCEAVQIRGHILLKGSRWQITY